MNGLNKKLLLLLFISLYAFVVSCTKQSDSSFQGIDLPIDEMNKIFRIEDPPAAVNNYKNTEIQILQIKNLSDKPIIFPGDFGIKIFQKKDDSWIPVENLMQYPGRDNNILPINSEFPAGLVVTVNPFIPNLQEPATIRIFLLGYIDSSSNKSVGSYIDMVVSP
jgi:hypothetical protein